MALHYAPDNASDTIAATRSSGSGTLSVWNGHRFGDAFPIFVAIFRAGSLVTALEISGRTGNDLTVAGPAPGYADDDLEVDDEIICGPSNAYWEGLRAELNALVGSVGGGNAGSFLLLGGQIAWLSTTPATASPRAFRARSCPGWSTVPDTTTRWAI